VLSSATHFQWPEEALSSEDFASLQNFLGTLPNPVSMELFVGGGIDHGVAGCQLLLTPIFKDRESAREAVASMERPQWVLGSFRTDMSGGFTILEGN
jgi:hypothetical protein